MLYVEPDFYKDFKCAADKCAHSCCRGWEIDIDPDTAELYMSLEGEQGQRLRERISFQPQAHFILDGEERCPFLDSRGLCTLITELGETALCDICREHPRFYNCRPDREERGLGLCCEAAAELLLTGEGPLRLEAYGAAEKSPEEPFRLRDEILDILAREGESLPVKMKAAAGRMSLEPELPGLTFWVDLYLGLEQMDDDWGRRLQRLSANGAPGDMLCAMDRPRYERIAEYFIFRHFAAAETEKQRQESLLFAFLSAAMVSALDSALGESTENLRLYSAEIEYSDENIDRIYHEIGRYI